MSLRARVLTGMAVIALVLVGAAVFLTRATESHLEGQVDEQLRAARVPLGRPAARPAGTERPGSLFIAIVDASGHLAVTFEPNLTGDPLSPPAISGERAHHAIPGSPFTVSSEDDDLRYRAITRSGQRGSTLVLALPLNDVDDAVRRLVVVEVAATLIALTVLALVAWWVIRLGVRPIKRMTETASAIAGGELSRRVPAGEPGTEARELGDALNRMLEVRIRAEEQLRRFVGDASHELRTPITTIRGYAELYRAGGLADPVELDDAMRRTEEESVRMGALVDDLLQLARLDQGRPLERSPVDVGLLARDAVRDARAVDPERPIDAELDGALIVTGDRDRLRQVLGNLVTNALVHTDPGTPLSVRARRAGDDVVLEVADRGPGMGPEVAERAFERFFRADPARSRHRGGSGLGLSIVAAIVEAHGGSVRLDTAPGGGTTVVVRLPASG